MKKKIAILGSTGSIGKTLIEIIKKDKKNFDVILLTAYKNYNKIFNQAKILNVKNLIITDENSFQKLKKKKLGNINVFNNYDSFNNIFKKKIDYVMSSISGIHGLEPTIKIIKHTKKIAIANKESIICGWHLIKKDLKKYKTIFVPVDSEHFSIFYALQGNKISNVDKIFLTASGGPLNNIPKKRFKNVKISEAIKHPNWKMGKKISVDSATMMNKVFEIIEAKKIFDLSYDKLDVLVHPKSYVHAIIKFNDGMIKIVAHDTNMKIPIFNSLPNSQHKSIQTDNINIKNLNFLNFKKVDTNKFPSIKIIKRLQNEESLLETIIVLANDELVNFFLLKKLNFTDITILLQKLINMKEIINLSQKKPGNINSILCLKEILRKKINKIIN
ncbi:1-deoxy-D-xylulose-5-phosphate reductoisomerase [Pelagibacterales bacterium SAG-MED06]|nr:1-deoxy-D-xylulose-5-phosphate reductoisomerase [Pelagibacterales bacterium SAG-MED06]